MIKALWVAKTGLDAQQMRMEVVSNNLANISTNGYKRGRAVFNDLLYQTIRQPGAQSSQNTELPSGLMLGTGVRTVATVKNFSQGNILQTNSSLDVAVRGKGFFQILLPDGSVAYTRDGAFQSNSQGQVVNSSGYVLQPAITIPNDVEKITIAVDGTVSVSIAGDAVSTQIGTVQLTNFINPAGLQPIGDNLYKETVASGAAQAGTPGLAGLGQLEQGALESSNVNAIEELVNLIETNRAYEINSKSIDASNKMAQFAINNL